MTRRSIEDDWAKSEAAATIELGILHATQTTNPMRDNFIQTLREAAQRLAQP